MNTEQLIQQALNFARSGQRAEARNILSQLVRTDPQSVRAWYLLSQVVDQDHQVIYCLERVLQLQPDNAQARQRLEKLHPIIAAPALAPTALPHKTSPITWLLLILTVPILTCMCCGMLSALGDDLSMSGPSQPAPQYATIRQKMTDLTELQWQEYEKGLRGDTATWTGWVDEVQQVSAGKVEILIDMDPPQEEWSMYDVSFTLPESAGRGLRKDQQVRFTGRISRVTNVLSSCQVDLVDAALK